MNKIKQMLQLQQQLNDATSGKGWEAGMTNKGKPIDWKRCIYLEAAELVDSYPWKHWKNIAGEPDYENIKIEVVDIWHFVMSEALRQYKINRLGNIDDLAITIQSLDYFPEFSLAKPEKPLGVFEQIAEIEALLQVLFSQKDIKDLLAAFFKMSSALQIYLPELYQLYVGKNILNQFRQDHGYKEGKYIKKWNGVEDNVAMQQILQQIPDVTPEQLYQLLEEKYPN